MSQIIGYARVSTRDQNPASQEEKLRAAGATHIFTDHGESSRLRDRPQWAACWDYMRPGDTLLVTALDRLAGGQLMALQLINEIGERGIHIKSLSDPDIDTTTPMGRALFGVVAVFLQLRVDTIRENTRRGLEHARAQGRVGGRPSVMTSDRLTAALRLRDEGKSHQKIAEALGVGKATVGRALREHDATVETTADTLSPDPR